MAFFSLLIAMPMEYGLDFKSSHNLKWLCVRNLMMVVHSYMIGLAQFYLPLPVVHIINSSSTLFICGWNYVVFGLTVTRSQLFGIFVGFMGVLLIISGRLLMSMIDPSYSPSSDY